jgi:hypothetical protein
MDPGEGLAGGRVQFLIGSPEVLSIDGEGPTSLDVPELLRM